MIRWIYGFCFLMAFPLSKIFFPVKILGKEHIPLRGGVIFACTHHSHLDPVILGLTTLRPLNFLAKEALFRNKLFGALISVLGAIPIRRGAHDVGAIKEALKRLEEGAALVIFPQGTRRAHREGDKILPGVGLLAARSGRPVVPVYLDGTQHVLPPGTRRVRRHPVSISFGAPLFCSRQDSYLDIVERITQAIADLAAHSSPDSLPRAPKI